jgi:hypothetical protein
MAADPFNSAGGYSVGIPPLLVIDENGNITSPRAIIANVSIIGDTIITGNVQAGTFSGSFKGNVEGNVVVAGFDTQIMYNNNGNLDASPVFTYNQIDSVVTVDADFIANTITLGAGTNEFSTSRAILATTVSNAPDQILHQVVANTVCSVDYTIVATETVANNRQTSKLFAGVLGDEVGYFEYGTIDVPALSPGVGDFKVVHSAGNVVLTVNPVSSNLINYKIMVTSYKE